MALPYPEGAVYFRRSALKLTTDGYDFDVQDSSSFYSHFLLENVWNSWAFSTHTDPSIDNIPSHPRSKPVTGYADGYGTHFGVWDRTSVMYSNYQRGDCYLSVQLDNNQNFNELRNRDQGGPLKVILRPVPLQPDTYRGEPYQFIHIDWVNPFRAVYFPIAHQAGPGYEDLCVYLMIDFRLRQGVTINSPAENQTVDLTFDREFGLRYRHTDVLSFDLFGIYNYLMLPQQLRNPDKDLYNPKNPKDALITLWDCSQPYPYSDSVQFPRLKFVREIDLVNVINDNYGVALTWQPYQYSSWVVDFLTHIVQLGLGFIPAIGPMLSVSFSIGLQAIVDPDSFQGENILNLGADIIAGLIDTGMSVRDNLPDDLVESDAKLLVIRKRSAKPSVEKAADGAKGITGPKVEDGESRTAQPVVQEVEEQDGGAKADDQGE